MKLGIVISQTDPETVWNAFRFGNFSLNKGQIFACGTCLVSRNKEGSPICPMSTMSDLMELVEESDKIVSF